jgi:hypothetical protein
VDTYIGVWRQPPRIEHDSNPVDRRKLRKLAAKLAAGVASRNFDLSGSMAGRQCGTEIQKSHRINGKHDWRGRLGKIFGRFAGGSRSQFVPHRYFKVTKPLPFRKRENISEKDQEFHMYVVSLS